MHSICWLGAMKKGAALQKIISSLQNSIGKPTSMSTMISIKPLKMKLVI